MIFLAWFISYCFAFVAIIFAVAGVAEISPFFLVLAVTFGVMAKVMKNKEIEARETKKYKEYAKRSEVSEKNYFCSSCGKKIYLSSIRIREGRNYCPACAKKYDNMFAVVKQAREEQKAEEDKQAVKNIEPTKNKEIEACETKEYKEYAKRSEVSEKNYFCSSCGKKIYLSSIRIREGRNYCPACAKKYDNMFAVVKQAREEQKAEEDKQAVKNIEPTKKYICSVCGKSLMASEVYVSGGKHCCSECHNMLSNINKNGLRTTGDLREFSYSEALEVIPGFLHGGDLIACIEGKNYIAQPVNREKINVIWEEGIEEVKTASLDELYGFIFRFIYKNKAYKAINYNEEKIVLLGDATDEGFNSTFDGKRKLEVPVSEIERVLCEKVSVLNDKKQYVRRG